MIDGLGCMVTPSIPRSSLSFARWFSMVASWNRSLLISAFQSSFTPSTLCVLRFSSTFYLGSNVNTYFRGFKDRLDSPTDSFQGLEYVSSLRDCRREIQDYESAGA